MNSVSMEVGAQATYNNSNVNQTKDSNKTEQAKKSSYGKTVGNPQLSDKAAQYYDSLKSKYNNMDFVLVSKDQKEQAKAMAAGYANPHKMVVLIDEEKIEKMAEDENFRKKYEGIIAQSASGMKEFAGKLAGTGANIKGFGMQVNDNGETSFFAVMKKSGEKAMVDQKNRIEKKTKANKEAKKAEAKKAKKKEDEKRLEKKREETNKVEAEDDETVTITASSMDELLQKIGDQAQLWRSDDVLTDSEKQVGQQFDFSV